MYGEGGSIESIKSQIQKSGMVRAGLCERTVSRVVEIQSNIDKVNYQRSFQYLQSKLEEIEAVNKGSVVNLDVLETESTGRRFYRLIIALASDINLARCCKPVVSFDAGILKHPSWCGWHILVMGMQDGNGQDCTIALAIVPTEDEESYTYFIGGLKEHPSLRSVLTNSELVVITDRCKGLIGAVQQTLPDAHHRYCALHLLGNIPSPAFGHVERLYYFRAVKSKTIVEFEERMNLLRTLHESAYQYLSGIEPSLWVDFAQPRSSWGMCTNNLSERAIGRLGRGQEFGARSLCPLGLLDYFIDAQIDRYNERARHVAGGPGAVLTATAAKSFEKVFEVAQSLEIIRGRGHLRRGKSADDDSIEETFYVYRPVDNSSKPTGFQHSKRQSESRNTVRCIDGCKYTCSCKQGRSQGLPCQHVCRVVQMENRARQFTNDLKTYTHPCLMHEDLKAAYESPPIKIWEQSGNLQINDITGPPHRQVAKSALGKRIASRSGLHSGTTTGKKVKHCNMCRNTCGRAAHYATKCPLVGLSQEDRERFLADTILASNMNLVGNVSNVVDLSGDDNGTANLQAATVEMANSGEIYMDNVEHEQFDVELSDANDDAAEAHNDMFASFATYVQHSIVSVLRFIPIP